MSQTHTLKRHTQHPHRSQTIPHCSLSEENQLLWSSKAVGSRLLKKQNKSNSVSTGLWRAAAARFKQLGDISSSVRPNSVLAQTQPAVPNGPAPAWTAFKTNTLHSQRKSSSCFVADTGYMFLVLLGPHFTQTSFKLFRTNMRLSVYL